MFKFFFKNLIIFLIKFKFMHLKKLLIIKITILYNIILKITKFTLLLFF